MTKTIFRTFKGPFAGEVIAIFPEIPVDSIGFFCMSYMKIGQHGASSDMPAKTRPATPEEIEPLKKELEKLGYQIEERKKSTFKMRQVRYAAARNRKK